MGFNVQQFDQLDSTNSYAMSRIDELCDSTVIVARTQTSGRGQFSRKWVSSNPENLYLSIVLKPENIDPEKVKNISLLAAEALVEIISEFTKAKIEIKLPNDVLVNNKKIAGILTETKFLGEKLLGIVLGIGVNLNMSTEECAEIDQPATSLSLEAGKPINTRSFQEDLLKKFLVIYRKYIL